MNDVEKLEQLRLRLIMINDSISTDLGNIREENRKNSRDILSYLKIISIYLQIITVLIAIDLSIKFFG